MATAVASAVLGTAVSFLGLAIARERAARREAAAQQAGRQEIERLLGGLPAVIFLRAVRPDGEARLLYRGGDIEVVTGWPAATFQGVDSLQPWIDLDPAENLALHGRGCCGTGRARSNTACASPMGGSRWIRSHCRVLSRRPDGGGEVVGYLLDITAERAAEARAMATGRLASLGEMAAGLAHELKQPLSIIALAAENAGAALGREQCRRGWPAGWAASAPRRIAPPTVIENLRRFARGPAAGAPAEAVPAGRCGGGDALASSAARCGRRRSRSWSASARSRRACWATWWRSSRCC